MSVRKLLRSRRWNKSVFLYPRYQKISSNHGLFFLLFPVLTFVREGRISVLFVSDELHDMFTEAGLEKVQNLVDRRLQVNRGKQLTMYRVWIQCKYCKALVQPPETPDRTRPAWPSPTTETKHSYSSGAGFFFFPEDTVYENEKLYYDPN